MDWNKGGEEKRSQGTGGLGVILGVKTCASEPLLYLSSTYISSEVQVPILLRNIFLDISKNASSLTWLQLNHDLLQL